MGFTLLPEQGFVHFSFPLSQLEASLLAVLGPNPRVILNSSDFYVSPSGSPHAIVCHVSRLDFQPPREIAHNYTPITTRIITSLTEDVVIYYLMALRSQSGRVALLGLEPKREDWLLRAR